MLISWGYTKMLLCAKWYVAPSLITKTIYKQIADELLYKTKWYLLSKYKSRIQTSDFKESRVSEYWSYDTPSSLMCNHNYINLIKYTINFSEVQELLYDLNETKHQLVSMQVK